MAAQIDDKSRALLDGKNHAHVATLREDGGVHTVLAWVDVQDGRVALNSAEGRVWPANVRRDPRVTVTVANAENPYEYTEIRGRVVQDTHEGADEHIDALAKKYLDADTYPFRTESEQRVTFRIEPERVRHHGQ
jgi:PPOX class probable F420-dependent enzyme